MKYFLFLFVAFILACQSTPKTPDQITSDVSVEEFKLLLEQHPEYVLLDVRSQEEADEGKIGDALVIDYFDENFDQNVMQVDTNKTILLYCRSGKRSAKAAEIMEQQGFKRIYNMEGGFLAWSDLYPDE